jgi:hypothetical protein
MRQMRRTKNEWEERETNDKNKKNEVCINEFVARNNELNYKNSKKHSR